MSITAICDILAFVQAVLLGALFLSSYKGNRLANVLLGLFILTFNFSALHSFFLNSGLVSRHLWLLGFPSLFLFWFGPLLYFYTRSLAQSGFSWKRRYYSWFVPAAVELLINIVLLSLAGERLLKLAYHDYFVWGMAFYSFFASLYSISFVIFAIKIARQATYSPGYATVKGKWLNYLLLYFLVRFIFWSLYFAVALPTSLRLDVSAFTSGVVAFFSAMDFLAIFCISFFSFRYAHALHATKKEAGYVLNATQEALYLEQLLHLMQTEKLYRSPDLKVSDVAERLNTNVKYVSQLIKTRTGHSFTRFINFYRIEEFKLRIVDGQFRHLTMAAIAEACGFSSKATFNRVFKELTGVSPKEYRVSALPAPENKASISENAPF